MALASAMALVEHHRSRRQAHEALDESIKDVDPITLMVGNQMISAPLKIHVSDPKLQKNHHANNIFIELETCFVF